MPFPPQGIFQTQGLNLYLLLWQVDSFPLSHLGSGRSLYVLPKMVLGVVSDSSRKKLKVLLHSLVGITNKNKWRISRVKMSLGKTHKCCLKVIKKVLYVVNCFNWVRISWYSSFFLPLLFCYLDLLEIGTGLLKQSRKLKIVGEEEAFLSPYPVLGLPHFANCCWWRQCKLKI